MATIHPTNLVFGVADPLPLSGFPTGKTRIRMRRGSFAIVYVRTPSAIREFAVKVAEGCWVPAFEIASNYRAAN